MLQQVKINKEVVIQPAPYQSVRVGVEVIHVRGENETSDEVLAQASQDLKNTLIGNLEGTVDELDYLDGIQWRARLGLPGLDEDEPDDDRETGDDYPVNGDELTNNEPRF